MHKGVISAGLVFISFLVPAFASAATITSVTVNGGSSVQVNPGDNIIVSVTAVLGAKEKWKGVDWGINTTGATPTCANTKNARSHEDRDDSRRGDHDDDDHGRGDHDDRKYDNRTFTETFIAKAPKQAGLYGITVVVDAKNRCGSPLSVPFTLPQSVRVGTNAVPPTFAPYSDIVVQLTASTTGTAVTYPSPTATDYYGNGLAVSCTPVSGSFFATGNNTVLCNAADAWGNSAAPLIFTISVLLPPDVTPPVIAPHANISVQATSNAGAVVAYVDPAATDNRDGGAVNVSCVPVSGALFAIGTTTVNCTASDAAGNAAYSSFDVGVYVVAPPSTTDTTPPVIAPHSDVVMSLAHAADTTAIVTYTDPTAVDAVSGAVSVLCTPASGSAFGLGTTTVTCSAQDAAGNIASSTFGVGVYAFVPQQIVIVGQTDESYLCAAGWRACFTGGGPTFNVDLGLGAGLASGTLKSVTVAIDPVYAAAYAANTPWAVQIDCFVDAGHITPCNDWVQTGAHGSLIKTVINTTDNKHWSADFGAELNFDGSSAVRFNPSEYYQLIISDNGIGWPAFGQDPALHVAAQPYWTLDGLTY